ncbi:MAG: phosphatidylglycerophosphatase A [Rickettsiales bacterium]|jgi:phosphatidylglycerophosphatase A
MLKEMIKDKFHIAIATGFGVGKIPFAPGTFGSLLGVLAWVLLDNLLVKFEASTIFTNSFWCLLILALTIIGIFSAEYYSKKTGKEDASEIVIDEICGQLLTFFVASFFIDISSSYLLLFLGFVFFRLFDITKPFVIGAADKELKGGLGVMVDDLLAGGAAAALLYITDVFVIKDFLHIF